MLRRELDQHGRSTMQSPKQQRRSAKRPASGSAIYGGQQLQARAAGGANADNARSSSSRSSTPEGPTPRHRRPQQQRLVLPLLCTASRFSSNSLRPLQQREQRLHCHMHALAWLPLIEVYYDYKDMWWSVPYTRDILSHEVDTAYYEWDSGSKGKNGTTWKDGEKTTISRYQLIIPTRKRSSTWTLARFYFFE